MPAIIAHAPGKIILCGEHAVVYGRPALAVPVSQVEARAFITASPEKPAWIEAPGVGLNCALADLPAGNPLLIALTAVQEILALDHLPAFRLKIVSTIPIASGLGSGTAAAVAIARAVSTFCGKPLDTEQISAVAYRVDQALHGTPSGIDNIVIAYAQPVYFVRGHPFERLAVPSAFTLVFANTGIPAATAETVGDLRRRRAQSPAIVESLFDRIAALCSQVRTLIETGAPEAMGTYLSENHALLCALDVSSRELDVLVDAALAAGALGAKMSGGGRGGNMLALVQPAQAETVAQALRAAGATQTIITHVA
jgi:mevalonate kinase